MNTINKFINKVIKSNKFDTIIYVSIVIISYFIISVIGNYVGLYYDSVNPEHLSPFLLNNFKTGAGFWAYPILGKVYHGLLNAYIMTFLLMLISIPSITLLHFVSASYGAFISCMIYKILKKLKVNKIIAGLVSILTSLSTALIYIYVSQYYIELTGMVFEIIAINLFINWLINHKNKSLLASGVLSSVACFGYYNYIFFAPSYIVLTLIESYHEKKNILNNVMIYIIGFVIGLLPYIIGYSCIIYNDSKYRSPILIFIIFFIIFWCITSYNNFKKDDNKKKKLSIFGLVIIIVYSIKNFLPMIFNCFSSLSSKTSSISFFKKIFLMLKSVKNSYFGLITGKSVENWIFMNNFSKIKEKSAFIIVLIIAISILLYFIKLIKNRHNDKKIGYMLITYFFYFLFAFFIAVSALSPQHFVPMFFMNMIFFGISIQFILNFVKDNYKKLLNSTKFVMLLILISIILINIFSNRIIFSELFLKGPEGSFSPKLNEIATEAIDSYSQNIKQIYVFGNWGFTTSFTYLTRGLIPTFEYADGNIDVDDFLEKYINDNQIVLVSSDEDKVKEYIHCLKKHKKIEYKLDTKYLRNGKITYYTITIKNK